VMMLAASLATILGAPTPAPAEADWSVKVLQYSALTIGVAMQDETVGWSSFTTGAGAIQITRTQDGGNTWQPVGNQSAVALVMGVDLAKSPGLDVVTTGMAATTYSNDGDTFTSSPVHAFASQIIKAYDGGRVAVATPNGACLSSDGGASYKCVKVPFKTEKTGRYVAWPSADTIYVTAGSWPVQADSTADEHQLTARVRVKKHAFQAQAHGGSLTRLEIGPFGERRTALHASDSSSYTAEVWKSSDGGATWTSVLDDEGSYYLNDIDCFDATHCVAVGEGFGNDGSASPGAKVLMTTDGTNFSLVHSEVVDGSSLMAAKMLSATEFHVGGQLQDGLSLHTVDGGSTFAKQGAEVRGQMITSFSFPTATHGFATSISQLQICSLLEYA